MPAKSRAQRRLMAICEHDPKHATGKCPKMTKEQFHDFASTKEKNLPNRVATRKAKSSKSK